MTSRPVDNKLKGRLALITGASGGIGAAIARALHEAGCSLALTYSTNESSVTNLITTLSESSIPHQVLTSHKASMASDSDLTSLLPAIHALHGRNPDILIANAGSATYRPSILDIEMDDFDHTITVNLRAPFFLTKLCAKHMVEQKWGRIVYISSIAAYGGGINGAHYAASKGGMQGMMRNLATRLAGDGITVNDVSPAMIGGTGMIPNEERVKGTPGDVKGIPVGRLGTTEEVGGLVRQIVGTGYMTGQNDANDPSKYTDNVAAFCERWRSQEKIRLLTLDSLPSQDDQHRIVSRFNIGKHFWSSIYKDTSGAFAAEERFSDSGDLEAYTTNFTVGLNLARHEDRTTSKWFSWRVLTHWRTDGKVAAIIQGNITPAIEKAVPDLLSKARWELIAADPYAVSVVVLESLLYDFDGSTWTCNSAVGKLERQDWFQDKETSDVKQILMGIADTPSVIARCKELAASANHLLGGMIKEHDVFLADHAMQLGLPKRHTSAVARALRSQLILQQCYHSRADALLTRMNNLTNMALVTIQQHDSKMSTKMAKESADIAATSAQISESALRDSSSTKTISVLGLIFLPSTLVCSIFSTTFFSLQPVSELVDQVGRPPSQTGADRAAMYWILSDKFWIFWVVSIPLTLLTISIWYLYTKRSVERKGGNHLKKVVDEEAAHLQ
ncbi:Short chain dehydrogenase-like protein 11 [Elsinoe fawcettii]|nr:Short chain dehydrogenase-like protein 11 [Elsinoe fawcettii]